MERPIFVDYMTDIPMHDLEEIGSAAWKFWEDAQWTWPCVFRGHLVAHEYPQSSQIRNFSTITRIVTLRSGWKVFLVYRYPLSWVHSLIDNIQKWATGRYSKKPLSANTWVALMERKSRIRIIHLYVPEMIAMPYIPNWNLWDILQGHVEYSRDEVIGFLIDAAEKLNALHERRKYWGEPVVNNMIVGTEGLENNRVTICDTEVEYYGWVTAQDRMALDWRDFIFSACGACRLPGIDKQWLARWLVYMIRCPYAKYNLIEMCKHRRTLLQVIFWQGLGGALSCSWNDYDLIRRTIAECK